MDFSINKYSLTFDDQALEKEFRKNSILDILSKLRIAIFLGGFIYFIFFIYDYYSDTSVFYTLLTNRIIVCSIAFIYLGLSFTKFFGKYYFYNIAILFLTTGYGTIHAMVFDNTYTSSIFSVVLFFSLIPFNTFKWVIIQNFLLFISFILILHFFTDHEPIELIKHASLFLSIIVVTILIFYIKQHTERIEYIKTKEIIKKTIQLKKDKKELINQAALAKILHNSTDPSIDLQSFLKKSLDIILDLPWLDVISKGSVFITNKDGNLEMVAHKDLGVLTKTCALIKPGQCLCGKALAQKKILFNSCLTADHDIQPEGMTPHGHFNIPFILEGKVLGVLNLYVDHNHKKTEEEVIFLSLASDTMASVIYRHQSEKLRKEQTYQLKRYFTAIEQSATSIMFSNTGGKILYANPYTSVLTGFNHDEIIGENFRIFNSGKTPKPLIKEMWDTIKSKKSWKGEFVNRKKDGSEMIESATITPIINEEGKVVEYLALKTDITSQKRDLQKIIEQKEIIEKSYQKINESIEYAKRIQSSLLSINTLFEDVFEDVSMLFLPKEKVSGDFYLIRQKAELIYLAVADCTGHGVPGALVSALGTQELSHLIDTCNCSVGGMLDKLNTNLNKLINNDDEIGSDGMDLTLLCINTEKRTISYSGAKGIFYIYQNDQLIKLKTDRVSIGQEYSDDFTFTTSMITYNAGDSIHLLSDGLIDQRSQTNQKRIGSKQVRQLLEVISKQNKKEKQIEITNFLSTHMLDYQTDDITLISLRLC